MSTRDTDELEPVEHHHAGMGLAARFTLGLAVVALLFAAPATWLLLNGATKLNEETSAKAKRAMARATGEARLQQPPLPEHMKFQAFAEPSGLRVLVGETLVPLDRVGETRLYRVLPPGDETGRDAVNLFAPASDDVDLGRKLVVLVLMVTGGLVLIFIVIGAVTAQRVAAPLRGMIEDVHHISHGRLDHHIHTEHARGEVAHLGRAMDRMVRGLVGGQEAERKLEKGQREAEALRELRRNLKPLSAEAPPGYELETALVEASGAGTGDFVDAMSDSEGRLTVVVGSTGTLGAPGALLTAMTRAYLRGAALSGKSPAEACDATNTSLNRDLARGLFVSAMVMRLDPAKAEIELVSAGHKAPAVRWDADADQLRKLQPNGIALGFDKGPVFRKSMEILHLQLEEGDDVFLFSPAAFEVTNHSGKKLGEKGVYALAKHAMDHGMPSMEKQLMAFLGGPPTSDLAFTLVRHKGGPA